MTGRVGYRFYCLCCCAETLSFGCFRDQLDRVAECDMVNGVLVGWKKNIERVQVYCCACTVQTAGPR